MPAKRADPKKAKKVTPKELSEDEQKKVTGGLNPQPVPPREISRRARGPL